MLSEVPVRVGVFCKFSKALLKAWDNLAEVKLQEMDIWAERYPRPCFQVSHGTLAELDQ